MFVIHLIKNKSSNTQLDPGAAKMEEDWTFLCQTESLSFSASS